MKPKWSYLVYILNPILKNKNIPMRISKGNYELLPDMIKITKKYGVTVDDVIQHCYGDTEATAVKIFKQPTRYKYEYVKK